MDSVANILSTPTTPAKGSAGQGSSTASTAAQSTDATGAVDPTATSTAGSEQGTQGAGNNNQAFGKLLAREIARTIPQLLNAPETKPNADIVANVEAPAVDPAALIKQINVDFNQLVASVNDGADTATVAKNVDKLLADDPALANDPILMGLLKKKKSGDDDATATDNSKTANAGIAVGNLPPSLAAATNVTGKDLPKDIGAVTTQVPATVAPKTQAEAVTPTEDKALNSFVNELTTKLAESNTDQTPTQQTPLNLISSVNTANTANAVNNNRADVVTPPVGSQTWDSALGEKVVWIVGTQTQNAELHLNPPALGPLEVRVTMSDGQASLSFMTQHAAVREAIEAATPRLREMMGDSGINMGNVSVNVGTFAQQQQDQAAQQQAANNRNNNTSGNDFSFGATADSTAPVETVTTRVQPLRDLGLVDLFA